MKKITMLMLIVSASISCRAAVTSRWTMAQIDNGVGLAYDQTNVNLTKVSFTNPIYTATVAKAASALQVEVDPSWTAGTGSIWFAINAKQAAGNYATGTPLYVQNFNYGAITNPPDLTAYATTQSIASVETDIESLGDVTNSYVVVDGVKFLYDKLQFSKPRYTNGIFYVCSFGSGWMAFLPDATQENVENTQIPPLTGWTNQGNPTNLNIRFVSGSVAIEEAARINKVNLSGRLFDNGTNLFYVTSGGITNQLTSN